MIIKSSMKTLLALMVSVMLVACGGGSSNNFVEEVETEAVWKLVRVEVLDVERTGSVDESEVVTLEYDGSGLNIKKVYEKTYDEYTYDDQGVLLKKETSDIASGDVVKIEEFDEYGEATRRLALDVNNVLKESIVYINKYPDDLEVTEKEIRQYVQSKLTRPLTSSGIELWPYLGSEIISRERQVTVERIEEFNFSETNKLIVKIYEFPDDGVADSEQSVSYNKYGLIVGDIEFDYIEDENGNLSAIINRANGAQRNYTWELMDVPVW